MTAERDIDSVTVAVSVRSGVMLSAPENENIGEALPVTINDDDSAADAVRVTTSDGVADDTGEFVAVKIADKDTELIGDALGDVDSETKDVYVPVENADDVSVDINERDGVEDVVAEPSAEADRDARVVSVAVGSTVTLPEPDNEVVGEPLDASVDVWDDFADTDGTVDDDGVVVSIADDDGVDKVDAVNVEVADTLTDADTELEED